MRTLTCKCEMTFFFHVFFSSSLSHTRTLRPSPSDTVRRFAFATIVRSFALSTRSPRDGRSTLTLSRAATTVPSCRLERFVQCPAPPSLHPSHSALFLERWRSLASPTQLPVRCTRDADVPSLRCLPAAPHGLGGVHIGLRYAFIHCSSAQCIAAFVIMCHQLRSLAGWLKRSSLQLSIAQHFTPRMACA